MWVHPIGVCVCGIISNIIAIMKLFREKKQLIQLRKVKEGGGTVITQKADGTVEVEDVTTGNLDYAGHQKRYDAVVFNRRMEYRRGSTYN